MSSYSSLLLVAAAAVTTLAACGGGKSAEINPETYAVGNRWNAVLATPAGMMGATQVRGSAWMAGSEDTTTRVEVSVENATPGGRYPWHVHRGTCGNDQGILGPANSYEPLEVHSDGRASQTAELAMPVPTSGSYFVNVHASPTNLGTIVACGNLAPPSQAQ